MPYVKNNNNNNNSEERSIVPPWVKWTHRSKACFSYVRKIPDDRRFYFLPAIPDSASISDEACFSCRENPKRVGILLFAEHPRFCLYIKYSPEVWPSFSLLSEFGGKWKVRQKLNLEHKCNSIYTLTWMHMSLCCVVLNTSAFFRSSMQGFLF